RSRLLEFGLSGPIATPRGHPKSKIRNRHVSDPAMQAALRAASRAWGPVTDWSLHPSAFSSLPDLVDDAPLLVLECGSGFSTLVLHEWVRRRGAPTRVLSFEHQPEQIDRLRAILEPSTLASVRHSSLSQVTEAVFRKLLAAPGEVASIWNDRADL